MMNKSQFEVEFLSEKDLNKPKSIKYNVPESRKASVLLRQNLYGLQLNKKESKYLHRLFKQ